MKKLLVVGLIIAVSAGLVLANNARLQSLGGVGHYVRDYAEIYYNPATLARWTDLAFLEFGTITSTDDFAGVNLALTDNIHVGANVGRTMGKYTLNVTELSGFLSSYTSELFCSPINNFNVMGAYGTGLFNVGVGVYKAGHAYQDKSYDSDGEVVSDIEVNSGVFGFNLGSEVAVGDATVLAAFDIGMNSLKEVNTDPNTTLTTELTGGSDISAAIRGFVPFNSNVELVAGFGFETYSFSGDYTDSETSDNNYELGDYSNMGIGVGVGANINIDDAVLTVGTAFNYDNTSNELDTSMTITNKTTIIPVKIGLEKPISKTFVGRIGVSKNMASYDNKTEMTNGSYTEELGSGYSPSSSPSTILSAGIGAEVGDFTIDWNLATNNLFSGTALLSDIAANLASTVTINYNFGD